MRTADFDFELPPELIAQTPAAARDQSRLLVLDRASERISHRQFPDLLEYFCPGDVLVLNDSRVFPARLRGLNAKSGGQFEILLLEENAINDWWVMLRPGKRGRIGTQIQITHARMDHSSSADANITATVIETNEEGHRRLRFEGSENIFDQLDQLGEVPLPPYIRREATESGSTRISTADRERYQTVFAQSSGSVAAPTAGLHFTEPFLKQIRERGVHVCFVTLHVGPGTFAPVKSETLAVHRMHEERYQLGDETVRRISEARQAGRRVIAVGTTSTRVLESVAASNGGKLVTGSGRTRIFIYPPYDFKVVDALLTNFHLPQSTLLMLVSAFIEPRGIGGRERALAAYAGAIRERYRFFSYGDAMFIH